MSLFARALLLVASACTAAAALAAPTFIVNSTADVIASAPLDNGVCETATGNNVCTLRAAIMKANHYPGGGVTIRFGLPGSVTYTLGIPRAATGSYEASGGLYVNETMTLIGNGAGDTIIDGNGMGIKDRVMLVQYQKATVRISGLTIRNGFITTNDVGSGILNFGMLTLQHCAVLANRTNGLGGGIYNQGQLVIDHTLIGSNSAAGGGGIYHEGSGLDVIASTISDNEAGGSGGGVLMTAAGTFLNAAVTQNRAGSGGGIDMHQPLTPATILVNTTVSGNSAQVDGGGIRNESGSVRLYSVTITGNHANKDGDQSGIGGGVAVKTTGNTSLQFVNSIIGSNFRNGLVRGVLVGSTDDCSGTVDSLGSSLMTGIDASHCTVNGTVTIADPRLDVLRDNGGPTQTHSLLAGSPAIDAGAIGGCTNELGAAIATDQRGYIRHYPVGGRCDIGAYEVTPAATLDIDNSGTSTRYEARTDGLLALRYMFGLTGPSLIGGAIGTTATRTDAASIKAFLDTARPAYDIDGDGDVDALTDGVLIVRFLFGLTGTPLTTGAVSTYASRKTSTDIEAYLRTLAP